MTIGFGGLRGLSDGWPVLFSYEISKTVSFGGLQDLNDGRICWVMKLQSWSVLVGYKVSVMVGFVRVTRFQ